MDARENREALASVTVKHESREQAGHMVKEILEKLTTKFSFQWYNAMVVKNLKFFFFLFLFVLILVFRDRVSLCSPSCPGTLCKPGRPQTQRDPPAPASRGLGHVGHNTFTYYPACITHSLDRFLLSVAIESSRLSYKGYPKSSRSAWTISDPFQKKGIGYTNCCYT